MSNKRCIFNSTIDCDRFVDREYVCIIFREKCENFNYSVSHVESESGRITSLAFKEAE